MYLPPGKSYLILHSSRAHAKFPSTNEILDIASGVGAERVRLSNAFHMGIFHCAFRLRLAVCTLYFYASFT